MLLIIFSIFWKVVSSVLNNFFLACNILINYRAYRWWLSWIWHSNALLFAQDFMVYRLTIIILQTHMLVQLLRLKCAFEIVWFICCSFSTWSHSHWVANFCSWAIIKAFYFGSCLLKFVDVELVCISVALWWSFEISKSVCIGHILKCWNTLSTWSLLKDKGTF